MTIARNEADVVATFDSSRRHSQIEGPVIMEHATTPETQAFLSDVADEMEAAARKLETSNGAATESTNGKPHRYFSARFGSKILYTACYTLSYGVCFPVFVACRYVPRNNQFVEGLIDGGAAASEAVDQMMQRSEERRICQSENRGQEALAPA